jgi:hypothetical protein
MIDLLPDRRRDLLYDLADQADMVDEVLRQLAVACALASSPDDLVSRLRAWAGECADRDVTIEEAIAAAKADGN